VRRSVSRYETAFSGYENSLWEPWRASWKQIRLNAYKIGKHFTQETI
jgi:hypothetical protein